MYFILSSRIRHRPQYAPLMDKRVVIHGTSRADMNGKCGVATDFHFMDLKDRTTWRYTVKLDSGEGFKLRPERLRAESEGTAGTDEGARTTKKAESEGMAGADGGARTKTKGRKGEGGKGSR